MEDMSGKINEILSDPKAMEQISALAGMLGLGNEPKPPPPPPVQNTNAGGAGSLSGLGNLAGLGNLGALGGLLGGGGSQGANSEMLQSLARILPLLNRFEQEDDSTRLLHALRPLLGEERRKKLDESIKIMQMLRLLPLLKNQGIL